MGQQFQSLGQEDDTADFFSLQNAVRIGLATEKEKMILEDFISTNGTAEQYVLPLRWAHNLVNKYQRTGTATDKTMQTISELIFTCRSGLSSLIGTTEAQIPLSFFHLLNFTMNVYCTLFAYSLCFVATWFCWITVIMYVVAMLGLREVSIMLRSPLAMTIPTSAFRRCSSEASRFALGSSTRLALSRNRFKPRPTGPRRLSR